jgi:hypothetical protein
VYSAPPKPWIFEGSFLKRPGHCIFDAAEGTPAFPKEVSCGVRSLSTLPWGTAEEQRAIHFYLNNTGPWLANYGARSHRAWWEAVLPRVATSLPASRHILIAVALLESPVGCDDPSVLEKRSQSIRRNCSMALRHLTQPNPHPADVGVAPLVAWLLETLSFHERRASIHQEAAQRIFDAAYVASKGRGPDEFVFDDKMQSLLWNQYRFRCLRCKTPVPDSDEQYRELAVAVRNANSAPVSAKHLHADLRDFVATFRPNAFTAVDVDRARDFVRQRERSILRSRYKAREAQGVFTALHLLCNTIILLLPGPVLHRVAGDDTLGIALDYVADQCYWLMDLTELVAEDKSSLIDVVLMMLQLIATYGPSENHRLRARDMLACLKRTGRLDDLPGPVP